MFLPGSRKYIDAMAETWLILQSLNLIHFYLVCHKATEQEIHNVNTQRSHPCQI